jgi:phosphatidate cytidylyltransferase
MMHNPFDSALFVPVILRMASLLVIGAVLVAVVERRRLRHPRELRESVLFKRVLSWTLMAPTFAVGVFVGGPFSLAIVLYLIVQSVREFAAVTGMGRRYMVVLLLLSPLAMAAAVFAPDAFLALPIAAFMLLSAVALARGEVGGSYRELTVSLFGFMYLPLLLSFFLLIGRHLPDGTTVLVLVGMSVALSDVCAFVAGKSIGGPRLARNISPNKTIAGVAGNVAGAYLALAVMAFAIPASWPLWMVIALPLVIALASVWGDLLESLIKRSFAVKDAGTVLPGFGGILDRIDSLIVAMPITYMVLRVLG